MHIVLRLAAGQSVPLLPARRHQHRTWQSHGGASSKIQLAPSLEFRRAQFAQTHRRGVGDASPLGSLIQSTLQIDIKLYEMGNKRVVSRQAAELKGSSRSPLPQSKSLGAAARMKVHLGAEFLRQGLRSVASQRQIHNWFLRPAVSVKDV